MSVPDNSTEPLLKFVDTFTPQSHPELVLMSGGEALLKAETVRRVAEHARTVGTRSYLLSGMYFAREQRIPAPVKRAIDSVDHFAASIDAFHEEEVDRSAVIRVLRQLMDEGKDVSIQIVGLGDDDPYLEQAVDDLRVSLDDRAPILVGHVGAVGRAAEWLHRDKPPLLASAAASPAPCVLAAWPLVRFDGKVMSCCNQDVLDTPRPAAHLVLGDAAVDSWAVIRERALTREMMRAVRLVGPEALASRPEGCSPGYCATCATLSDDPLAQDRARELAANPRLPALETAMGALLASGGPVDFARRHGSPRYADLVLLGQREGAEACAP
jgi:hypothetical protein